MKFRTLAIVAALTLFGATATTAMAAGQSATGEASPQKAAVSDASTAPRAEFPELGFTFEPVVDGTPVTHDFPVKNTGDGPLAIRKVKTG